MIHISPELNSKDELVRVHIEIPGPEYKRFQELVQRGSNLWPDAPDFIKRAADIITNGKVMQEYDKMSSENRN